MFSIKTKQAHVLYHTKKTYQSLLVKMLSTLNKKADPEAVKGLLILIKKIQHAVNSQKAFSEIVEDLFLEFQRNNALDVVAIKEENETALSLLKASCADDEFLKSFSSATFPFDDIKKDLFFCLFLAAQRTKLYAKDISKFEYVNCTSAVKEILQRIEAQYAFDQKMTFESVFFPRAYYTGHLDQTKKPIGNGFFCCKELSEKRITIQSGEKIYQDGICTIKLGHEYDEYIVKSQDLIFHFKFKKLEQTTIDTYLSPGLDQKIYEGVLTVSSVELNSSYTQEGKFTKSNLNIIGAEHYPMFSLSKGISLDCLGNKWQYNEEKKKWNVFLKSEDGGRCEDILFPRIDQRFFIHYWLSKNSSYLKFSQEYKFVFSDGRSLEMSPIKKLFSSEEKRINYFSADGQLQLTYVGSIISENFLIKPHKFGCLQWPDGSFFSGYWSNGILVNKNTKMTYAGCQKIVSGKFMLDEDDFYRGVYPKLLNQGDHDIWDISNRTIERYAARGRKKFQFQYEEEGMKFLSSHESEKNLGFYCQGTGKFFVDQNDRIQGQMTQNEIAYSITGEWFVSNENQSGFSVSLLPQDSVNRSLAGQQGRKCRIDYFNENDEITRSYEGPLDDKSRPSGCGQMFYPAGENLNGIWKNGKFLEQCAVLISADGMVTKGYFSLDDQQYPKFNEQRPYAKVSLTGGYYLCSSENGYQEEFRYDKSSFPQDRIFEGTMKIVSSDLNFFHTSAHAEQQTHVVTGKWKMNSSGDSAAVLVGNQFEYEVRCYQAHDLSDQGLQLTYVGPLNFDKKPHGRGSIKYPGDAAVLLAEWNNGVLEKVVRLTDSNGVIYEGQLELDQNMRPIIDQNHFQKLVWNKMEGTIKFPEGDKCFRYESVNLDENNHCEGILSYTGFSAEEKAIPVRIIGKWRIDDKAGCVAVYLLRLDSYVPTQIVFENIPGEMIRLDQLVGKKPESRMLSDREINDFILHQLRKKWTIESPLIPAMVQDVIGLFQSSLKTSVKKRLSNCFPDDVCDFLMSDKKIISGINLFLTRILTDCHHSKPERTQRFMAVAWKSFLEFLNLLCQQPKDIPFTNKQMAILKFIDIILECDESIPVRINDICVSLKKGTVFCDPYRSDRNQLLDSFVPRFLEICQTRGAAIHRGMHIHVLPFLANHFSRVFQFETDHKSEIDSYAQQAMGFDENRQPVPTRLQQCLCKIDSEHDPDDVAHAANVAFAKYRMQHHVDAAKDAVLADLFEKLSPYLGKPLSAMEVKKIDEDILEMRLNNLCGGNESGNKREFFDDRGEYFLADEDMITYFLNPQLFLDLEYFVTIHLEKLGYLTPK